MRAALLNLAATELREYGLVTYDTRCRLAVYGLYAVQLEQYLSVINAPPGD